MKLKLDEKEIEELLNSPEAITVLVDYHAHMETLAEATDHLDSAKYHKNRATEFKALRSKAETERAARHGYR